MKATPIEKIQGDAAAALHTYHDRPDAPEHSRILRRVAELLCDLREHFLTDQGRPDWAGRSYAYRQAVGDIYSRSGIPRGEQAPVSAAVRYHIGNVLRDRLSEEDLESAGLIAHSPRDRSQKYRAQQSALVSLFSKNPAEGEEPPIEMLRSLAAAAALLTRVTPAEVRAAPIRDRRAAALLLDEAAEKAAALRRAAGKR